MKTGKRILAMLLAALMAFGAISVVSFADGASETEPNNTYDKANTVAVDTAMGGSLSTTADVDWFTFKAGADGTAKVAIAHNTASSDNVFFTVQAFSAANAPTGTSSALTLESKGSDASKDGTFAVTKDTTYYVRVKTANTSAVNVNYTLTCSGFTTAGGSTTPSDTAESEPNNAISTADVLTLGKLMSGSLATADDVDCYSFTCDGDAMLNLEFSHAEQAGQTSTFFTINVYNSSNAKIADAASAGTQTVINLKDVELSAGIYYIEVSKGFTASSITYQLGVTLSAPPAATAEAEPNDSFKDANKIRLDKPMIGALTETVNHTLDYDDYYYFTVSNKGVLDFSLKHEASTAADNAKSYFKVFLYDGSKSQIAELTSCGKDASVSVPKQMVEAGTYYVCVTRGEVTTGMEYSLKVNVISYQGSEAEPNDEYSNATEIKTGTAADSKAYLGSIEKSSDVDLYKFVTAAQGYAYIDFTNVDPDKETDYTVALCTLSQDPGEVKMDVIKSFTVENEDGDYTSGCIGLKPGEYYIKVTGDDVDGGSYAVAVRFTEWTGYESELNDKASLATAISDKGVILGSSFDADDLDYFAFKYDDTMTFTITGERAYTTAEKTSGLTDGEEAKWIVYLFVPGMNNNQPVTNFTFTNGKDGAGKMEIKKNAGNFASGVYYLCIKPVGSSFSNKDYRITITAEKNTAAMSLLERFAAFRARIKAIDWSNLGSQFAWMKQFFTMDTVKVFGTAIKGLMNFINQLFN